MQIEKHQPFSFLSVVDLHPFLCRRCRVLCAPRTALSANAIPCIDRRRRSGVPIASGRAAQGLFKGSPWGKTSCCCFLAFPSFSPSLSLLVLSLTQPLFPLLSFSLAFSLSPSTAGGKGHNAIGVRAALDLYGDGIIPFQNMYRKVRTVFFPLSLFLFLSTSTPRFPRSPSLFSLLSLFSLFFFSLPRRSSWRSTIPCPSSTSTGSSCCR